MLPNSEAWAGQTNRFVPRRTKIVGKGKRKKRGGESAPNAYLTKNPPVL